VANSVRGHPPENVSDGDPVPGAVTVRVKGIQNVDRPCDKIVVVVGSCQDLARIEADGPLKRRACRGGGKDQQGTARFEIDKKPSSRTADRQVPRVLEPRNPDG
jgi:hypothetical protein